MLHDFDPETVAEIRAKLDGVRSSGVRIGFAIESGSRAWGFPSPDSDYDCRFVYVRRRSEYLSLFTPRDVIEFPIVGDIDVGGWDLRKALLLALRGNAVLVEWATSPIVYEEEDGFRQRLKTLLDEIMVPRKVALHYVGLLMRHMQGEDDADVRLKKLLYAIRPVIALAWMEERGFTELPPMNMMECLEGGSLDSAPREAILSLVEVKKATREMGQGPIPASIRELLVSTRHRYEDMAKDLAPNPDDDGARGRLADAFFLSEVEREDNFS